MFYSKDNFLYGFAADNKVIYTVSVHFIQNTVLFTNFTDIGNTVTFLSIAFVLFYVLSVILNI